MTRSIVVTLMCPLVLAACGGDAESLSRCDDYDPLGFICTGERIDLQSAEALAREQMPDNAQLWEVSTGGAQLPDPDGGATIWGFAYFLPDLTDPDGIRLVGANVRVSPEFELLVYDEPSIRETGPGFIGCVPTEGMKPLDTRAAVPDALRRFEAMGRTLGLDATRVVQIRQRHPCDFDPGTVVLVSDAELDDRPLGAFYDDDGNFLRIGDAPQR